MTTYDFNIKEKTIINRLHKIIFHNKYALQSKNNISTHLWTDI